MKSISIYINEKLSFKDKFYKFTCKIMGLDCVTQEEYIKDFKKAVEEYSDDKCSIIVKTLKQVRRDFNNCLNKDEELTSHDWGKFNIKKGIEEGHWWNDITLSDDVPFVCYYSKENTDKFVLEPDSLWFISAKTKKGNRDIMGGLMLNAENPASMGWCIKNIRIPQTLDYDKWLEDEKIKNEEEKKKEKESINATIQRMENELAQLKKLVKDKEE